MSKVADAALALTEAFFRVVPQEKKKRLSEAQWTVALRRFHLDALKIRQQYGLGLLGRALAAYHFQKRLLHAGMEADIVRKVVFSLMLNALTTDK